MSAVHPHVIHALLAAALFGASTPLAKVLVGDVPPLMLGGLLYLGSGLGLGIARLIRDQGWSASGLPRGEWRWLLAAIVFGGMLGPVLLMYGLQTTTASTASLLLNLEAVLTAVLAWVAFREHTHRRVVIGILAIVAGGALLSLPNALSANHGDQGSLTIAAACLCWAIDNNLTRRVSSSDAMFIASVKGLVAGSVNCAIAIALGLQWPATQAVLSTMVVGLLGYGASLVLFVLALRGLGTARTGAYFSTAPFLGAALALLMGEPAGAQFWWAGTLMAFGVWLHLTETHEHEHPHEPMVHEHPHTHDEHHQHAHDADWDGSEPHNHRHHHEAMTHKHPHYPDIHHRHSH